MQIISCSIDSNSPSALAVIAAQNINKISAQMPIGLRAMNPPACPPVNYTHRTYTRLALNLYRFQLLPTAIITFSQPLFGPPSVITCIETESNFFSSQSDGSHQSFANKSIPHLHEKSTHYAAMQCVCSIQINMMKRVKVK